MLAVEKHMVYLEVAAESRVYSLWELEKRDLIRLLLSKAVVLQKLFNSKFQLHYVELGSGEDGKEIHAHKSHL